LGSGHIELWFRWNNVPSTDQVVPIKSILGYGHDTANSIRSSTYRRPAALRLGNTSSLHAKFFLSERNELHVNFQYIFGATGDSGLLCGGSAQAERPVVFVTGNTAWQPACQTTTLGWRRNSEHHLLPFSSSDSRVEA
jgi:hypothetical protein